MTANHCPSDPLEKPVRRALVVSGDDRFASAMSRYLESEGWQTDVATNELDAEKACNQNPPHVMLVELEGHEIDGFELLAALRAPRRGIPSVLLARRMGADDVDPRVLRALGIVQVVRLPCPFAFLATALESIFSPPNPAAPKSTKDRANQREEYTS